MKSTRLKPVVVLAALFLVGCPESEVSVYSTHSMCDQFGVRDVPNLEGEYETANSEMPSLKIVRTGKGRFQRTLSDSSDAPTSFTTCKVGKFFIAETSTPDKKQNAQIPFTINSNGLTSYHRLVDGALAKSKKLDGINLPQVGSKESIFFVDNTSKVVSLKAIALMDSSKTEEEKWRRLSGAQKNVPAASSIIPLDDSPVRGDSDALVTAVAFFDYQCPYSARTNATMKALLEKYPGKLRVALKHMPLPFHKQADAASKAAFAAQKQGGDEAFWKMHDWLFSNQKKMEGKSDSEMKKWTAAYAAKLGLDAAEFRRDFDSAAAQARITKDGKLFKKLGARGTPIIFVNGVRVKGAKSQEDFAKVIDRQHGQAKARVAQGATAGEVYAAAVKANYKPAKQEKKSSEAPKKVDPSKLLADAVYPLGSADAEVPIVMFGGYQCPYTKRAFKTLILEVLPKYEGQVRLVFRHFPIPSHQQGEASARAALAAGEQGKFWEMHVLLFANQEQLESNENLFLSLARSLDLDVKQFRKDMEKASIARRVKSDLELGKEVGVRGTPSVYVNGKQIRGAQPADKWKEAIDEALDR